MVCLASGDSAGVVTSDSVPVSNLKDSCYFPERFCYGLLVCLVEYDVSGPYLRRTPHALKIIIKSELFNVCT